MAPIGFRPLTAQETKKRAGEEAEWKAATKAWEKATRKAQESKKKAEEEAAWKAATRAAAEAEAKRYLTSSTPAKAKDS